MKIKIEANKGATSSVPISDGIASANMLFTSGQICLKDGKILEGSIEDQVNQVMMNLKTILNAGGYSFDDVVKTTVYVTDMSIGPAVNTVYRSYLTEPYPAREMVCVKELPLGAKVEISMVAAKSE